VDLRQFYQCKAVPSSSYSSSANSFSIIAVYLSFYEVGGERERERERENAKWQTFSVVSEWLVFLATELYL
jgi:hypothetical protein